MPNPTQLYLGTGSVDNDNIISSASIETSKLQHRYNSTFKQNGTAASETKVIHVCYGTTGTIKSFKAGSVAACSGAATITLDLKKNGTTCLSSVITLDNANSAYVVEPGTLSVTSLVSGDVLTVVTVATAGGGTLGTGLFAEVVVDEVN